MSSVPLSSQFGLAQFATWPDDNSSPGYARWFAEAIRPATMGRNCEGCGAPLKYDGFRNCQYCGRDK